VSDLPIFNFREFNYSENFNLNFSMQVAKRVHRLNEKYLSIPTISSKIETKKELSAILTIHLNRC